MCRNCRIKSFLYWKWYSKYVIILTIVKSVSRFKDIRLLKNSCLLKNGVAGAEPPYRSSAICATASCSGFVWLTASILAWTRGGSPSNIAPARMPGVYAKRLCTMQSQPSIHSPSPRGRGLGFRQGCRDRTPKGFAGRKAHKAFL